jgi:hypothetical protein
MTAIYRADVDQMWTSLRRQTARPLHLHPSERAGMPPTLGPSKNDHRPASLKFLRHHGLDPHGDSLGLFLHHPEIDLGARIDEDAFIGHIHPHEVHLCPLILPPAQKSSRELAVAQEKVQGQRCLWPEATFLPPDRGPIQILVEVLKRVPALGLQQRVDLHTLQDL